MTEAGILVHEFGDSSTLESIEWTYKDENEKFPAIILQFDSASNENFRRAIAETIELQAKAPKAKFPVSVAGDGRTFKLHIFPQENTEVSSAMVKDVVRILKQTPESGVTQQDVRTINTILKAHYEI